MRDCVVSAAGKAEESRCDKKPQSTSAGEVEPDIDQTFPQSKPDSSKCCQASPGGPAPSLTSDKSIRRAEILCLDLRLSPALLCGTVLEAVDSRDQAGVWVSP